MRSILLFGASGQLGKVLAKKLTAFGRVHTPSSTEGNFLLPQKLLTIMKKIQPDWIVNAAAYTDVAQAESKKAQTLQINAQAPGLLANFAARHHALFVHYSSHYVFSGRKRDADGNYAPYVEQDQCHPLNIYGYSKKIAEDRIMASGCAYVILRTGWLFSDRQHGFIAKILAQANEKEIAVVDDEWGQPTSVSWLAQGTLLLLQQWLAKKMQSGIYHLTCKGSASRWQFAQHILQQGVKHHGSIKKITSCDYASPVKRPLNGILSLQQTQKLLPHPIPSWEDECARALSIPNSHEDWV